MRLSLLIFIAVALSVVGCQNPDWMGLRRYSPYDVPPVNGPGPGVITPPAGVMPPAQQIYNPVPINPPKREADFHSTPNMYYPTALTVPYDPADPAATSGLTAPNIPDSALGRVTAAAATPNSQPANNTAPGSTLQIKFGSPEALVIHYDAKVPGKFDSQPLICPAEAEFGFGNVYRLKLSNIPGRPGKELYPTLELAPPSARTMTYLVHCPIPIEFTDNDFDQVLSGNLITKVVYLPNREFQGLAVAGVAGTIVNTDLDPGIDPITEAQNRGAILAIVRMGNKDLRLTESESLRREALVASLPPGVPPQAVIPSEVIGTSIPRSYISGYDIPPYGTPMTKTTTGVPGPPQLPVAMDSGYRYPLRYAEPIPAPPTARAYAQPMQPGMPAGMPPAGMMPTGMPAGMPPAGMVPTGMMPPNNMVPPGVAPVGSVTNRAVNPYANPNPYGNPYAPPYGAYAHPNPTYVPR
ncbi:MAG: hypothetical protein LBQ66_05400 [Planctomycetaceae bacterium]|nr:hypothetical protein [Planctomycetaceae bacterium]